MLRLVVHQVAGPGPGEAQGQGKPDDVPEGARYPVFGSPQRLHGASPVALQCDDSTPPLKTQSLVLRYFHAKTSNREELRCQGSKHE